MSRRWRIALVGGAAGVVAAAVAGAAVGLGGGAAGTAGGLLATLAIGACACLYPAWRAARMPPTDALTTP